MSQYAYVAYRNGLRQTGLVSARDAGEVATHLGSQGLTVISVTVRSGRAAWFNPLASRQLSLEEKIFLLQNLATFLGSGIPILEALRITAIDTASPRLERMLDAMMIDLQAGKNFSAILANYPETFDSVFLALVQAGEETGMLKEIFHSLAEKYKQDAQTISRVRSAFIYPAVIFIALILLGGVLSFFVLPRITVVFARFAVQLPLVTRLLISYTKLLNAHPIITIAGLISLGVGVVTLVQSRLGKQTLNFLGSHLPLIKNTFWYLDLQRFTATLAILVDAAVPIQSALEIAGKTIAQPTLAKQIQSASRELAAGRSLAVTLTGTMLPHTVISLMAAGEQSATLGQNLRELEQFYREHLDEALRNLTALIEPLLTLFVGVVVGGVVIAIIVPIYQLVGRINPGG